MPYPTSDDLRQYLNSASLLSDSTDASVVAGLKLDVCISAAIKNFESDAGRTMIAVQQTRKFDPPKWGTKVLNLNADLASGSSFTVSIAGSTKTKDTDYYMIPSTSEYDGNPYAAIEFPVPWTNYSIARKAIQITGYWGFAADIPNDAYIAILAGGAALAVPAIQRAVSQGLIERKEGDTDYKYAENAAKDFMDIYKGGVDQYVRVASWIGQ